MEFGFLQKDLFLPIGIGNFLWRRPKGFYSSVIFEQNFIAGDLKALKRPFLKKILGFFQGEKA